MPLFNASRAWNNLLTLIILSIFLFIIYSKLDKEKVRDTIDNIKAWFGNMGGDGK